MAVLVTKFLKELLLVQHNYCASQNTPWKCWFSFFSNLTEKEKTLNTFLISTVCSSHRLVKMYNTLTHTQTLTLSLSLSLSLTLLKTNVLFRLKSSEPGADKNENFFFIYSSIGKRKVLQKHGPLCILETTNFVRAIGFWGFKVSLEFRRRLSFARIMIKLNGKPAGSLPPTRASQPSNDSTSTQSGSTSTRYPNPVPMGKPSTVDPTVPNPTSILNEATSNKPAFKKVVSHYNSSTKEKNNFKVCWCLYQESHVVG